jgi:phosphatidylserine/phosphatidylglycerophosphate/cardiolipin synthase-like enzyme
VTRDAAHVPPAGRASYPLRPGNAVRPLVDGAPAFRRICEAIESARHCVWLTVAFIERDAALPDGRGSLFDLLDRAVERGLDVRVLLWREPRLAEIDPGSAHFGGSEDDRRWLLARGSRFQARWDRLDGGACQHQKSFLIDAGEPSEVAFVGGINIDERSMSEPGYPERSLGNVHDVYLELRGPSASDVHHNFVQRWNEASERAREDGAWPAPSETGDLEPPRFLSASAGDVPVQISRTVPAGRYSSEFPAPGHKPFPVSLGEESAFEQYVSAVAAAERTLYFENQAIASPIVVDEIERALVRGVRVVFLVPASAHPAVVAARRSSRAAAFFAKLASLGRFDHFTLATLSASRGDGRYEEVFVHAKVAIADDAWATVGSTNVTERSFRHHTELNASFWHAPTARSLRETLFENALGRSVAGLGELEAFDLYHEVCLANRDRRTLWQPLEGLAWALDPAHYGA